jgi:hypothetical protein
MSRDTLAPSILRSSRLRRAAVARMKGALRAVAVLACVSGIASLALPARGASVSMAQSAGATAAVRWQDRLLRLDPLRPLDYLELGEEVADAASGDDERELARQLFGLAGALDTERLGRSAMLALAALAVDGTERARAEAAAELVGGKGVVREGLRFDSAQIEALSRSFSHHRRGDGRRAQAALRQNGADTLLEAIGPRLPGGAQGYRDECAAMRAAGVSVVDPDMVRRQLEVELALRRGELRGLSLDAALRGDAPLIEIDLGDPRALWGVDPSRPWWRDGSWRGNG